MHYHLFFNLLKAHFPKDYFKYIVVITEKNSPLFMQAQANNINCLCIPKNIGGRYSVFSSAGLFPLVIAGVDVQDLLQGAQSIWSQKDIGYSSAVETAAIRFNAVIKGYSIHDLFLFSNDLECVGKWYRQLVAESLGKEKIKNKKRCSIGITPIVSIGTTDLHSMAQLYFAGPQDKFSALITLEHTVSDIIIPALEPKEIVSGISQKSTHTIMQAIEQAVVMAYKKKNMPYIQIILREKSSFCIGALLQYMMIEVVFLGHLLEVNPFNQPEVELYKRNIRKTLHDKL